MLEDMHMVNEKLINFVEPKYWRKLKVNCASTMKPVNQDT